MARWWDGPGVPDRAGTADPRDRSARNGMTVPTTAVRTSGSARLPVVFAATCAFGIVVAGVAVSDPYARLPEDDRVDAERASPTAGSPRVAAYVPTTSASEQYWSLYAAPLIRARTLRHRRIVRSSAVGVARKY